MSVVSKTLWIPYPPFWNSLSPNDWDAPVHPASFFIKQHTLRSARVLFKLDDWLTPSVLMDLFPGQISSCYSWPGFSPFHFGISDPVKYWRSDWRYLWVRHVEFCNCSRCSISQADSYVCFEDKKKKKLSTPRERLLMGLLFLHAQFPADFSLLFWKRTWKVEEWTSTLTHELMCLVQGRQKWLILSGWFQFVANFSSWLRKVKLNMFSLPPKSNVQAPKGKPSAFNQPSDEAGQAVSCPPGRSLKGV